MSFKPAPQRLLIDIVDAIEMIEQFTFGMTFERFRSNPMAVAAVERKLQIISEAAIRMGDEAERLCPGQPWRDIRGIGNHLRHAYERIDLEAIWNGVIDDLPSLKDSVIRVLRSAPANPTEHNSI